MSEGRTPEVTLNAQRELQDADVEILHDIVLRAQNNSTSADHRDTLLDAYQRVFAEHNIPQDRHDKACFNVILELLDPTTPGATLYDKFEHVLRKKGIEVDFRDHTTQHSVPDVTDPPHSLAILGHGGNHDDHPRFEAMWAKAVEHDRRVLLRQTLQAFRGAAAERRVQQLEAYHLQRSIEMEARADAFRADCLKRKVFKQWYMTYHEIKQMEVQSDQVHDKNLVRRTLCQVNDVYKVRHVQNVEEERLKGMALYKWTLQTREAQFFRCVESRLKKDCLQKLIRHCQDMSAKRAQLEALYVQTLPGRDVVLLSSVLSLFARKAQEAKEMEVQAESFQSAIVTRPTIHLWRTRAHQVKAIETTSEDAREYFLMRRYLAKLKSVTLFRHERRTWLAKWVLIKMRTLVVRRRHERYEESYRSMRRTIKLNMARRMLNTWREQTQAVLEMKRQAEESEHYKFIRRVTHSTIEKWFYEAMQKQELERNANSFRTDNLRRRGLLALTNKHRQIDDLTQYAERLDENRIQASAHRAIKTMQRETFQYQQQEAMANAFRARRNKEIVRDAFGILRVAFAGRRGGNEGQLMLVSASAVTPARRREELLLSTSTRLSTTPAYTPFAARLRAEPKILEIIEDEEEDESGTRAVEGDDES